HTAIEASLTGHLVFSTLHTNSAPETLTRLLDMGLDPFNFADALLGVLAQRLARTLCKACKEAGRGSAAEVEERRQGGGEAEVGGGRGGGGRGGGGWRGGGGGGGWWCIGGWGVRSVTRVGIGGGWGCTNSWWRRRRSSGSFSSGRGLRRWRRVRSRRA